MKAEPKEIEALARFLCQRRGRDPDELEPGSVAYHSSFDLELFRYAEYDHLFDADAPGYEPDGVCANGDPGMFAWRDHVIEAVAIRKFLNLSK